MILIARQIIACSMLLLTSVSLSVQASVVMTGTRIIYPEGSREKVLQLSNKDDHPNLVQLWMDDGNNQSSPSKSDVPFALTPQIFRMEANSGQVVRLTYIARNLPKNRESVFYLNFLQIPALKADTLGEKISVTLDTTTGNKLKYITQQVITSACAMLKLSVTAKPFRLPLVKCSRPTLPLIWPCPLGLKPRKGNY